MTFFFVFHNYNSSEVNWFHFTLKHFQFALSFNKVNFILINLIKKCLTASNALLIALLKASFTTFVVWVLYDEFAVRVITSKQPNFGYWLVWFNWLKVFNILMVHAKNVIKLWKIRLLYLSCFMTSSNAMLRQDRDSSPVRTIPYMPISNSSTINRPRAGFPWFFKTVQENCFCYRGSANISQANE